MTRSAALRAVRAILGPGAEVHREADICIVGIPTGLIGHGNARNWLEHGAGETWEEALEELRKTMPKAANRKRCRA